MRGAVFWFGLTMAILLIVVFFWNRELHNGTPMFALSMMGYYLIITILTIVGIITRRAMVMEGWI